MDSLLQVLAGYLRRPAVAATIGVIVGLIIGLVFGWVVWPVEWTNATPEVLRADLQEDYMRMAIDSFRVNGNQALALQRWDNLGASAPAAFFEVQQAPENLDPAAIDNYRQVITAARGPIEPGAAPADAEQPTSTGMIIISVAGILILAVIIFGAFYVLRNVLGVRSRGEPSAAMMASEINRQTERTVFDQSEMGQPVAQTAFTYLLGDDLFDESISITSPDGKFLGECGASISNEFGVGSPKKVNALEVWVFDQSDIQTSTKVFVSEYIYDDTEMRSNLAAKGEIVLMEPNKELWLETNELKVLVRVIDFEYGEGNLPPNSFFARATFEFAVWKKEG